LTRVSASSREPFRRHRIDEYDGKVGMECAERAAWVFGAAIASEVALALPHARERAITPVRRAVRLSCARPESRHRAVRRFAARAESRAATECASRNPVAMQAFSSTERRWNRTIQAESCSPCRF
jgi:hypothetical protein